MVFSDDLELTALRFIEKKKIKILNFLMDLGAIINSKITITINCMVKNQPDLCNFHYLTITRQNGPITRKISIA